MNIRTTTLLTACALLLLASRSAHALAPTDLNDYTLDVPPAKGAGFTVRQASSLTEHWDKYGVVRLAVMSDHNQGYEFWSGVELIDTATKKLFNVGAVRCFVSFCVYVGKVPPGKYFINRAYADSFVARSGTAPIRQTSAAIRNQLGSFEVRVHSLTDLGLVGVFRGVEASDDQSFETGFLGYSSDLAQVFDEIYRGFDKKYFGLTGPALQWDPDEWLQDALRQGPAQRRFFADFSRPCAVGQGLFFPTVMGTIYSLDWGHGLTSGEVGTLFMLTAASVEGDRWTVGTEAGRLHISEDRGASWRAVDAFGHDEVVVHLFEREGVQYAVTVSQGQGAAKLYRAAGESFTEVARTRFELEGKTKVPAILANLAGGSRSLTQLYLNRMDLKKVRVLESSARLTLQLNSRHFASFDFSTRKWSTFKSALPVRWAAANQEGIWLMSETIDNPAKKKPEPITTIVQLGPGLEGPRGHREIRAVPRGALQVREDGNKMAVLSLEGHTGIYALIGNEPPALLQALGGKGFYYDNELRVTGDALVLIDRVAPRAYRFLDGQVATYSLYVP